MEYKGLVTQDFSKRQLTGSEFLQNASAFDANWQNLGLRWSPTQKSVFTNHSAVNRPEKKYLVDRIIDVRIIFHLVFSENSFWLC